jgi:hypothetical protein
LTIFKNKQQGKIKMKFRIIIASMFVACSMHAQTVKELQAEVTALQQQVAALRPLTALAPFVSVDLSPENGVPGPNVVFKGVNVHIVNGMGQTQIVNGLGNLIIGYSEYNPQMTVTARAGSHNLVLGRYHAWTGSASGNLLSGEWNLAIGAGGFAAGYQSELIGLDATVLGGSNNVANSDHSVILGGYDGGTDQAYQILQ